VGAEKRSASLDAGEHGSLDGMQFGIALLGQRHQFIQFGA